MLNYDGSIAYYLDPNDYTKKVDGTESDVANVDFPGNAMLEWPKIYVKRWNEDNKYSFRCATYAVDEEYDCVCNYDINGEIADHFYTSIYQGTPIDSKIRSLSGQSGNCQGLTSNQIFEYANAL